MQILSSDYSDEPKTDLRSGVKIFCDKPDIWPTCIGTKEAVAVPKNHYVFEHRGFSDCDSFTYNAYRLSLFDTIYINTLAMNQKKQLIGFNDINRIYDSLLCAIALNAVNKSDVYGENPSENLKNMIDHLVRDEYNYIFKQYPNQEFLTLSNPFKFLDIFAERSWKDIKENKYLLDYLLSNEEMVRNRDNFAFMGDSDQRIKALRSFRNETE